MHTESRSNTTPPIPFQKSRNMNAHICFLLVLTVLLTGLVGCVHQLPTESDNISSEADSTETSSQNDYTKEVDATIDFKEPKTRDCVAFSIDLPGNLAETEPGEKFFSRKYGIMMVVQKCSKLEISTIANFAGYYYDAAYDYGECSESEISTIEEFADYYYDVVNGYGEITTSAAGHLCFFANNKPMSDGSIVPLLCLLCRE